MNIEAVPASLNIFNCVIIGERRLRVTYPPSRVNSGQIFAAFDAAGYTIVDVSTREVDLEEVFLSLTQASDRDD